MKGNQWDLTPFSDELLLLEKIIAALEAAYDYTSRTFFQSASKSIAFEETIS